MLKKRPYDVRGAKRRGWKVVTVPVERTGEEVSWTGLNFWIVRHGTGSYVSDFRTRRIAFESERDAMWFTLKWL
jgi:hypothetical protein